MAKNRVVYGFVVLVFLALVLLRAEPMTYLALYAVLILPALSFLIALAAKYGLVITETLCPDYAQKGETVLYTVTARNRTPFPVSALHVRFQAEAGVEVDCWEAVFSVRPLRQQEAVFSVSAPYRGNYALWVDEVRLYDFLGLFSFRKAQSEALTLTVAPQIWAIAPLPLATVELAGQVRDYRKDEGDRSLSELRLHQPTDDYKKIHWKASAKRNELISRDFLEPRRQSAVFLMDHSPVAASPLEALAFEDLMADGLVSALYECNRQGYSISLRTESGDAAFTDDFARLFRRAVGLRFDASETMEDQLSRLVQTREGAMNLVALAQTLSENVCALLRTLQLSGSRVILFYFEALAETDPRLLALRAIGVHCLRFGDTEAGSGVWN
ncbi:MAG: DUF58 domain-containing protein [Oscillospiraceae bacterium]|nr:DUF58 domain-containing protein [Oscillospiraceae bacterium]